nr:molybdopterin molybdotransferase MoeA [Allonocardiopsis opalescens]
MIESGHPRSGRAGHRHAGTTWPQARAAAVRLAERARPAAPARVPLADAAGATLAEPLYALTGLPGHDAAAMDGYAVAGAGPWRITGRVLAGEGAPGPLRAGECVEIATGAPAPQGTEAVLPYEYADRDGDTVRGEAEPGRHVRRRGEDCAEGERVLPAGAAVTPAVLGLAAALGHDALSVRRPRVSVLVTGDELATSGRPAPGLVRDAVGPLLPGLTAWAGGAAEPVRYVPDTYAAMVDAVASCRAADVVVVCGASSAGPADHLRAALAELGAEIAVDGVAVRPGHPQLLGRLPRGGGRDAVVIGLPGNPYAALGAAVTLLVPVLRGLAGRPPAGVWRTAPLPESVRAHPADTRLVAVRLADGRAVPVGHDRPGVLWGAALADALAVVPPGWTPGDGEAELLPLPG